MAKRNRIIAPIGDKQIIGQLTSKYLYVPGHEASGSTATVQDNLTALATGTLAISGTTTNLFDTRGYFHGTGSAYIRTSQDVHDELMPFNMTNGGLLFLWRMKVASDPAATKGIFSKGLVSGSTNSFIALQVATNGFLHFRYKGDTNGYTDPDIDMFDCATNTEYAWGFYMDATNMQATAYRDATASASVALTAKQIAIARPLTLMASGADTPAGHMDTTFLFRDALIMRVEEDKSAYVQAIMTEHYRKGHGIPWQALVRYGF